jgi:hypothetical protein
MRGPKIVLVIGSLLALGAAGCGSSGAAKGGSGTTPEHVIETAYQTTENAKTADVAFNESIQATSTSGSNESENVTGSGQMDLANQNFDISVNSPSGGAVKVLETGGTLYIQVPPADASSVPGDKPWESIDLNQVDQAKLGKSFSQLNSLNSENPTQALANLATVSDGVTKVGPDTVGGVATTEYKAQIDLSKVASQAQAKDGAKAADSVTQEQQALGTSTIPVTVWVDAKGLVRQISEQTPIPAASSGAADGAGKATVTMTFSNYGAAVQLTPPASSQVADVTAQALQEAKAGS